MFESFKYLWSIADRTKANKEEFSDVLDRLETFLINIDNYSRVCKNYSDNSLFLEINAKDNNDNITTYKIPLKLNDNCK